MALLHLVVTLAESLRAELAGSPLVVLGTFAAIMTCIVGAVAGSVLSAVALFPLALVWAAVNQHVEGPTLVTISDNHGVTLADVLSLVAVLVALIRIGSALVRPRRASADRTRSLRG